MYTMYCIFLSSGRIVRVIRRQTKWSLCYDTLLGRMVMATIMIYMMVMMLVVMVVMVMVVLLIIMMVVFMIIVAVIIAMVMMMGIEASE